MLLTPLATALGAVGELGASRATLEEVLSLLGPEQAELRARVVGFIALVDHMRGHHHSATELLETALAGLPDHVSRERAELTYQLAWDHSYRSEYIEMAARARAAHGFARELGDRPLIAGAAGLLALADYNLSEIDGARVAFDEGVGTVAGLEDAELGGRLDALVLLGWVGHALERFEEGLLTLARGVEICRATGQGHFYVPMVLGQGMIRATQGDLGTGAELAADAEDVARLSNNSQWLTWALTLRSFIAALAGDVPTALSTEMEAVDKDVSHHYYSILARCYLAAAHLEAGEPDRCVEEILSACEGPELPPIERPFRAHIYEILGRAELARGQVDDAAAWAERAHRAVANVPLGGHRAEALRAKAGAALGRGDSRSAACLAGAAAREAARAGRALDLGRSRLLRGSALAAAGARGEAIGELDEARRTLAACGARRLEDAAAWELRRLGRRVSRVGRPKHADEANQLSARELEIARLVSAGKTNREIASELFLSEKTVEGHLTNGLRQARYLASGSGRQQHWRHAPPSSSPDRLWA
jgi:ATP/maltotriose-dependent transcriptional regulator MalT